jgi:hypothetical protein
VIGVIRSIIVLFVDSEIKQYRRRARLDQCLANFLGRPIDNLGVTQRRDVNMWRSFAQCAIEDLVVALRRTASLSALRMR